MIPFCGCRHRYTAVVVPILPTLLYGYVLLDRLQFWITVAAGTHLLFLHSVPRYSPDSSILLLMADAWIHYFPRLRPA